MTSSDLPRRVKAELQDFAVRRFENKCAAYDLESIQVDDTELERAYRDLTEVHRMLKYAIETDADPRRIWELRQQIRRMEHGYWSIRQRQ